MVNSIHKCPKVFRIFSIFICFGTRVNRHGSVKVRFFQMLVQIFENYTLIAVQRWTSDQLKDTTLIMGFQLLEFGGNIFKATIFRLIQGCVLNPATIPIISVCLMKWAFDLWHSGQHLDLTLPIHFWHKNCPHDAQRNNATSSLGKTWQFLQINLFRKATVTSKPTLLFKSIFSSEIFL